MSTPSYVCGTSSIRLIGDTIGAHFDRAVARWGPLDALVVRHQGIRWTYAELKERVDAQFGSNGTSVWSSIMVNDKTNAAMATPSALTMDGSSFFITWDSKGLEPVADSIWKWQTGHDSCLEVG
jgi:hypothetical protein